MHVIAFYQLSQAISGKPSIQCELLWQKISADNIADLCSSYLQRVNTWKVCDHHYEVYEILIWNRNFFINIVNSSLQTICCVWILIVNMSGSEGSTWVGADHPHTHVTEIKLCLEKYREMATFSLLILLRTDNWQTHFNRELLNREFVSWCHFISMTNFCSKNVYSL